VPAAVAAAAARVLRKQLDAEARTALTAAMAVGADQPPLPAEAAADATATWAGALRSAVRRAVGVALADSLAGAAPAEPAPEPAGPLCPDLTTWVEHIYVTTFIRRLSQTQRWCPSWWAHAEAIVRLQALWQTWEAARLATDGAGLADWLRSYLDPINPGLLGPDGPFASCAADRHSEPAPLPVTAPPAGYWTRD